MSIWTLQQNGGTPQTLAAWGLDVNAELQFRNLASDFLTLIQPGSFTAGPLFTAAPGASADQLTLYKDDTVWFVGYVREAMPGGTPEKEIITYRAYNCWEWMERVTLQQPWATQIEATLLPAAPTHTVISPILSLLSRLILGTRLTAYNTSVFIDVGGQIADIMDFATGSIYADIPMQFAEWTETTVVPAEQVRDISIAAAILRLLRWLPDTVSWWDYTTSPPTLHLARLSAQTAQTLTVVAPGTDPADCTDAMGDVELNPRHDTQITGVVLRYLQNGQNGEGFYEMQYDVYPGGTTGLAYGNIVADLDLIPGRPAQTVQQDIQTLALPADSAVGGGDPTNSDWQTAAFALMEFYFPGISLPHFTNGYISALTYSLPPNTPLLDGIDFTTGLSLLSCLVDGAVTPWMQGAPLNIEGQYALVTATFTWTDTSANNKNFSCQFVFKVLATNLPVTGLSAAQTMTLVTSNAIEDEAPPTGLAEALYTAWNALQWDGTVRKVQLECDGVLRPGVKLNFAGGPTAWESANTMVQTVTEKINSGITTAKLGHPNHLSAQDYLERARVSRDRGLVLDLYARATGSDSSPQDNFGLGSLLPVKPHPYLPPAMAADGATINGYSGSGTNANDSVAPNETQMYDPVSGTVKKAMVSRTGLYI